MDQAVSERGQQAHIPRSFLDATNMWNPAYNFRQLL
jgi:hypothetical protein